MKLFRRQPKASGGGTSSARKKKGGMRLLQKTRQVLLEASPVYHQYPAAKALPRQPKLDKVHFTSFTSTSYTGTVADHELRIISTACLLVLLTTLLVIVMDAPKKSTKSAGSQKGGGISNCPKNEQTVDSDELPSSVAVWHQDEDLVKEIKNCDGSGRKKLEESVSSTCSHSSSSEETEAEDLDSLPGQSATADDDDDDNGNVLVITWSRNLESGVHLNGDESASPAPALEEENSVRMKEDESSTPAPASKEETSYPVVDDSKGNEGGIVNAKHEANDNEGGIVKTKDQAKDDTPIMTWSRNLQQTSPIEATFTKRSALEDEEQSMDLSSHKTKSRNSITRNSAVMISAVAAAALMLTSRDKR